jgi:acetylornithine deacetylase/succinyl-diaminopimelate desuccinylase family protein
MKAFGQLDDLGKRTREATELTQALIRFPSVVPPGEYQEIASFTASVLEDFGADDVSIVGPSVEKANVLARFQGQGAGPTLVLNGHLDVVPVTDAAEWRFDPFGGEIVEGCLYGRGAVDMKGQVATMIVAMKALKESDIRTSGDVVLAFTIDEEEGSDYTGAGYVVQNQLIEADYVIVGEPSDMDIVRYHKGVCWFRLETHGQASHAGYPEKGVNAVEHMAQLIQSIKNTRLTHEPHPIVGSYSLTFNTIKGGTKTNCIADHCEAEFDVRPVPGQAPDKLEEEIQQVIDDLASSVPSFKAELIALKKRAALDYPESYPLFDLVSEAARLALGRAPGFIGHIANSDAQHFRKGGIPAVWMGPGQISQNAHSANEFITLEQLEQGVRFFAQAAVTICGT